MVLLQTTHDYPTSVPTTVTSSRKHAAILPRDFSLSNHPPGRVHTASGMRLLAEYADNLISAAFTTKPSKVECVRQIKPKVNAVRLKVPRSQPTTGMPTTGCAAAILVGLLAATVTPPGRCRRWGCPRVCYHHGHKLLLLPAYCYDPP